MSLVGGDESICFLVVDSEGLLQLGLHGVLVWLLHEELGAELAELGELDLAGTVLIDLLEDVIELLLRGPGLLFNDFVRFRGLNFPIFEHPSNI